MANTKRNYKFLVDVIWGVKPNTTLGQSQGYQGGRYRLAKNDRGRTNRSINMGDSTNKKIIKLKESFGKLYQTMISVDFHKSSRY